METGRDRSKVRKSQSLKSNILTSAHDLALFNFDSKIEEVHLTKMKLARDFFPRAVLLIIPDLVGTLM